MNFAEVLKDVRFCDWRFVVLQESGRSFLQIHFTAPDTSNPSLLLEHHGRKWALSEHMTKSEVVQTAFMAALACVEHEAREEFRYMGRAVFGPHLNVDALWGISRDLDARPRTIPHGKGILSEEWLAAIERGDCTPTDGKVLVRELRRLAPHSPQGWRLVPEEPTEEMLRASYYPDFNKEKRREMYKAMLAALPQPPASTPRSET